MVEHEAQKKVNGEVRDQLPKEVTKHALRKKTERARKVYDLFFVLLMIKFNGCYISNE